MCSARARLERMRALGIVNCALSPRTPGVPAWETLTADEKDAWRSTPRWSTGWTQGRAEMLDQVPQSGQWENTLVLFASDNGDAELLVRGDGGQRPAGIGEELSASSHRGPTSTHAAHDRSSTKEGIATP